MKLKQYLKETFGKDLFTHLKKDEILEERIKIEKKIEKISDDVRDIQDKIQALMIQSKGQAKPMKLLNIQKIKALRLESNTLQEEAGEELRQLQLILLLEAMREHKELEKKNAFVEKILDSDVNHLMDCLFDEDVKKAIKEGKIDDVKNKLKRTFAREEMPTDDETEELLGAIDDLESVDDATAIKMASKTAKKIAEEPIKKRESEEE